jgi:hypothetical protein
MAHSHKVSLFRVLFVQSLVLTVLAVATPATADEIGTSGWYWPLGYSPTVVSGGEFLGNGCGPNNTALGGYGFYYAGLFHLGVDMAAPAGTKVYAVGDGAIKRVNPGFGGDGNAISVEHSAADGSKFMALYGHLKNNRTTGNVSSGEVLGEMNTDHTHFGIHPGGFGSYPDDHLGTLSCSTYWPSGQAPVSTNGFVDPVPYLKSHPRKNLDSDGDGINNPQDMCPTTPGPRSVDGCPVRNNDVFQATGIDGVGWRVSLNGTGSWQPLRGSTTTIDSILLGDFDNDGSENDVFQASGVDGVGWRVSLNGTSSWQFLRDSTTTKGTLLLGDFDADGHKDDVFQASGIAGVGWRISYNGTSSWQPLKDSTTTARSLLIGDFNGDKYSNDVFQATGIDGIGWRVVHRGNGSWQPLKDSAATIDTLLLGDFDNDGSEDDVFQASGLDGIGWRVSYNGTSGWQQLRNSGTTKNMLLVGDFN